MRTKRLNQVIFPYNLLGTSLRHDQQMLEQMDSKVPDLVWLSDQVWNHRRDPLPVWLYSQMIPRPFRAVRRGEVEAAILRVLDVVRYWPRHARSNQSYLAMPRPSDLDPPRHLKPT